MEEKSSNIKSSHAHELAPLRDDPDGYALSVNIARRHLTPSQRAAVSQKFAIWGNKAKVANAVGVSVEYLRQAAIVADHSHDLLNEVVSGSTPLNEAYKKAQERKAEANSR